MEASEKLCHNQVQHTITTSAAAAPNNYTTEGTTATNREENSPRKVRGRNGNFELRDGNVIKSLKRFKMKGSVLISINLVFAIRRSSLKS